MRYISPAFFDDFKCTADKCTDSCCIGWEIDVDEETRALYEKMNTPFGEKLRKNIIKSVDGCYSFKLKENERCPFLNDNNLCDIILNCGEESICYICKEHPRFYNDFSEVTEYGLGLCCEEVCRLLIENDEPLEFVVEEDDYYYADGNNETACYNELYKVRKEIYDVLSLDMPYNEKIEKICAIAQTLSGELFEVESDKMILEKYEKTEPINKEWSEYFDDLSEKIKLVLEKESPLDKKSNGDKIYSKLLAYIIFRHLMNSIRTDRPSFIEYLSFCISGVRFIKLCDMKTLYEKGEITLKDRIDNIKRWSSQIEYSEENMDLLTN